MSIWSYSLGLSSLAPAHEISPTPVIIRLQGNATEGAIAGALERGVVLLPIAVSAAGARAPDARTVDEAMGLWERSPHAERLLPMLDHAGPSAAHWSSERPSAPAAVAHVPTGRTPRALTDNEWNAITEAFVVATRTLSQHPVMKELPLFYCADDDGLLMAALSPRTNPDEPEAARLNRAFDIIETCLAVRGELTSASTGIALCIDELCPGGLDLTLGALAYDRALRSGIGCRVLSSGTHALPTLRDRPRVQTQFSVWSSSARQIRAKVEGSENNIDAGNNIDGVDWIQAPAHLGARTDAEVRTAGFDAIVVER